MTRCSGELKPNAELVARILAVDGDGDVAVDWQDNRGPGRRRRSQAG